MPHAPRQQALPRFIQRQYAFAAHIRNPQHAPAPADVAPQRMAAYTELFYNNIHEALSNAFPVLRALHNEARWHALVRDFFATHRARTPLFHELPREFLRYLQDERVQCEEDYPFLLDLAHYEWVELELLTAEDEVPAMMADGDLLGGVPILSSLCRLLSYHYAVQKICPDHIPQQPDEAPTHLLVWRNREDVIGFIELNPVSARLLQLIGEQPERSGRELLEQVAQELNHPNPQTVLAGGHTLLDELRQRGIVLGTRPPRRNP